MHMLSHPYDITTPIIVHLSRLPKPSFRRKVLANMPFGLNWTYFFMKIDKFYLVYFL